MIVEVDKSSGFCFGVVNAISKAEECLASGVALVSLGDIVHNGAEVARLEALGMETVPEDTGLSTLAGRTVLIRAHGEPPATYDAARRHGITLIDATCPVVARLQETASAAHEKMVAEGGRVVIFGKRGHAEVRGLAGQVERGTAAGRRGCGVAENEGKSEYRTELCTVGMELGPNGSVIPPEADLGKSEGVIVIEGDADLDRLDLTRPVYFLAQTTCSLSEFVRLGDGIRRRAADPGSVTVHDTVCRRVSGREEHLAKFARRFDVVIFVAGAKSSNGRVLFEAVRAANPDSHKIENAGELRPEWFSGKASVGVCGATSTPKWLMNGIAEKIMKTDAAGAGCVAD